MDFNGGLPFFRDLGVKKEDGLGFNSENFSMGNEGVDYADIFESYINNDNNNNNHNHNESILCIDARGDTTCGLTTSASSLLESLVMIPNDKGKSNDLCTNQMTVTTDELGRERTVNPNAEKRQKVSSDLPRYSDDSYSWRKYGQKDVKKSQFPRSYYRCSVMNCPVKKLVERSLEDGHIRQIIYKGRHNHSEAQPSNLHNDVSDKNVTRVKAEIEGSSLDGTGINDLCDDPLFGSVMKPSEPLESNLDLSSIQNHNDHDEVSLDTLTVIDEEDGEGGPSDSRRRKRYVLPSEAALEKSSREPRVVVQVQSESIILDDGYRWRKYGQKVVKGNHNPRSYYKCTTEGCLVRKQVERAANDATSVITTYDGKHNHEVPSSKNSGSLAITASSSTNNASTPVPPKQDFSTMPSQMLPLYMDRNSLFNYNEFMSLNMNMPLNIPTTGSLNLAPFTSSPSSSYFPRPFSQFHSLPYPSSSNVNSGNHHMRPYQSSSPYSAMASYPMIPDFMSLPSSQMNHRVLGLSNVVLPGNSFGFNNSYSPIQTQSLPGQEGQNLRAQQAAVQQKNNKVVRTDGG